MSKPSLETVLHALHNMTDLLAAFLEDQLGSGKGDVRLTERQAELILFAGYDAAARAKNALSLYLATERAAS